ncbi:MAG: type II toxin-antitoxin system RelE/ParE family toxin [Saprospiraceae bacterium]
MKFKIIAVPTFLKKIKRLTKKYRSIKANLTDLFELLETNPRIGTPLGHNCYKIRLAISSQTKGKSNGARLITNFVIADTTVYLLSIYDKSEKINLTDKELKELLKLVPE